MKKSFRISLTCAMIVLSCGTVYGADEHAAAIGLIDKGKYEDALKLLLSHLDHNPGDLNAQYYIGNCFAKLGAKEKAAEHYGLCVKNAKDANLAATASAALAALNLSEKPDKKEASKPAQSQPPKPESIHGKSEEELARHAQAESDVARQLQERLSGLEKEKEEKLSSLRKRFDSERASIERRLQEDIAAVPQFYYSRRGYQRTVPGYYDTVSQLRTEANLRLDRLRNDESRQTDNLNDDFNKRKESLADTSATFWNQLHAKKGNVQLSPQGTNLYIRNYSTPEKH